MGRFILIWQKGVHYKPVRLLGSREGATVLVSFDLVFLMTP
jgi:hypothetical protein